MRIPRWPSWVYGAGDEPDYRFSFANERTFLAWIRTALALIAGGVALDALDLSMDPGVQRGLALGLTVLGAMSAGLSWTRWAVAERAVRRNQPLPSSSLSLLVAVSVVVVAIVILSPAAEMAQVGASNERTALAWQRTSLALIAGAAIISRLTFERLGLVAWVALGVVMPLSAWVLVESRGRYVEDAGTGSRLRSRGGKAPAAVSVATLTLALVELLAIVR